MKIKEIQKEISLQLQAKALYLAGWHSIEQIAKTIKVSSEKIKEWKELFNWDKEKPYFQQVLTQRNDQILLESIAQMNSRHIKMLKKIQQMAENSLDKLEEEDFVLSPNEIAKFIEIGVKSERLIRGQATDRKEIVGIVKENMQVVKEIIIEILNNLKSAGHITDAGIKMFASEFIRRLNNTEIKTMLDKPKHVEAEVKS